MAEVDNTIVPPFRGGQKPLKGGSSSGGTPTTPDTPDNPENPGTGDNTGGTDTPTPTPDPTPDPGTGGGGDTSGDEES